MTMIVIGEALIDVVSPVGQETSKAVGGSPLNVAVGLARLNHAVKFVTEIGDDLHGGIIREYLTTNRVALITSERAGGGTSTASALIDAKGGAKYAFSISWDISEVRLAAERALQAASHVHVGSIASQLSPGSDQVLALFKDAPKRIFRSFDPNCRPQITPNNIKARDMAEQFIAHSNVVKASDEDINWLYPDSTYRKVAERWIELGAEFVAVTRGDKGAWSIRNDGLIVDVPAMQVNVVDTIGAGDSFMAAILSAFSTKHPDELSRAGITEALRHSVRSAAITCTRAGANPPVETELASLAYQD